MDKTEDDLVESLAALMYYAHEHCRVPGFYVGDGITTYEDGSSTRVDWASLSDTDDDLSKVDNRYFRAAATSVYASLPERAPEGMEVERIARALCSVHAYRDVSDTSFWDRLVEDAADPKRVDRAFFRRLASRYALDRTFFRSS